LELPELPVGILEMALLCVTTHQPLVTTTMLVLPAAAAEDLEQVWAAYLAADGKTDIDSAMAVGCSQLEDATGKVWAGQLQPLVVDIATLLLATNSQGGEGLTTGAAAPPAAGAPAIPQQQTQQQLQSHHGAVSRTSSMDAAVRPLAAHLIHYLVGMNAYSLAELVIMRVAALQGAVGKAAACGQAPTVLGVGMPANEEAAAAGAIGSDTAACATQGPGGGTTMCSNSNAQVLSSKRSGTGAASGHLPEPATPQASGEPMKLQQLLALSPSSSTSGSSTSGSSIGSRPLLCPRLNWEPVRAADAFIAMQTLLMALRVSLEAPAGHSAVVGVVALLGWHLLLLGPTLALLVPRRPLVGSR
jgi:hypothetical protein